MPPLLLQPLLENMFIHGAEKNAAPFHIEISTERKNENVFIRIASKDAKLKEPMQMGEGLRQVRERLQLAYGDEASFSLRGEPELGVLSSYCHF